MLVVTPTSMLGHAMETKTINPSGAHNQDEFRRDQQQQRKDSPRKTTLGTGTSTNQQFAGRGLSLSETAPAKTIPKLISKVERNEDAKLAADRNIQLWCVPLLTTGAIHGQYYRYLQELVPAAGDPDREALDNQYCLGWSCKNFRTYSFMSAAAAVINAAGIAARYAADTVSRHYDVPGPSRLHHNRHNNRLKPTEYDFESASAPYDADAAEAEIQELMSDDPGNIDEQSPTAAHDAIFTINTQAPTASTEPSASMHIPQ